MLRNPLKEAWMVQTVHRNRRNELMSTLSLRFPEQLGQRLRWASDTEQMQKIIDMTALFCTSGYFVDTRRI